MACSAATTCHPTSLKLRCHVQAWLPDSPRWLLFSGAPRDQVFAALSRCKGAYCDDEYTQEELQTMQASSAEAPKSEGARCRCCAQAGQLRALAGLGTVGRLAGARCLRCTWDKP